MKENKFVKELSKTPALVDSDYVEKLSGALVAAIFEANDLRKRVKELELELAKTRAERDVRVLQNCTISDLIEQIKANIAPVESMVTPKVPWPWAY